MVVVVVGSVVVVGEAGTVRIVVVGSLRVVVVCLVVFVVVVGSVFVLVVGSVVIGDVVGSVVVVEVGYVVVLKNSVDTVVESFLIVVEVCSMIEVEDGSELRVCVW